MLFLAAGQSAFVAAGVMVMAGCFDQVVRGAGEGGNLPLAAGEVAVVVIAGSAVLVGKDGCGADQVTVRVEALFRMLMRLFELEAADRVAVRVLAEVVVLVVILVLHDSAGKIAFLVVAGLGVRMGRERGFIGSDWFCFFKATNEHILIAGVRVLMLCAAADEGLCVC